MSTQTTEWDSADWIVNNRLKKYLQNYLHFHHTKYNKLKNLRMCGSGVAKQNGAEPAVFLMANGTQSHFYATTACHSAWACPSCTAVRMAQYGEDIGAAIDALRTQSNIIPFMATFTLPHMASMSCEFTLQLLLDTWRNLAHTGTKATRTNSTYTIKSDKGERSIKNKHGKTITRKKGETVSYSKDQGAYATMRDKCQIKHVIRVYEFTYGVSNGWHPHIHALFFVPKKLFKDVLQYESKILDQWWNFARKNYIKLRNKAEPDMNATHESEAEELFADWRKFPKTGHRSVFFSKTESGDLREVKSSRYITEQNYDEVYNSADEAETESKVKSGWGGDSELTLAHAKEARAGHFTPQQLILHAFNMQRKNPEVAEQFMKLFCDYAMATFKHRRVDLSSKSGLTKIIAAWKKTQTYINRLKKNLSARKVGMWKVVCWFNEKQWSQISFLEKLHDESIKAYLLYLAPMPDARELIKDFLEEFDIQLIERKHDLEEHIENNHNHNLEQNASSSVA